MAVARYQHRSDCFHRSLWTGCIHGAPQVASCSAGSLRFIGRHDVLYASWRLVRLPVCDNFHGGAAHASTIRHEDEAIVMVEELEQEYAALKDKVHDLREYL